MFGSKLLIGKAMLVATLLSVNVGVNNVSLIAGPVDPDQDTTQKR